MSITAVAPWAQGGPDYDCFARDAAGNVHEMRWQSALRTLTFACVPHAGATYSSCDTTVFFDGNLNPGSNDYVKYVGRASIYFNGTISLHNSDSMCPWFANNSAGSTCTPRRVGPRHAADRLEPGQQLPGHGRREQRRRPVSTTPARAARNQTQVIGYVLFAGSLYTNGCIYTSNGGSILGAFIADYVEFAGVGRLLEAHLRHTAASRRGRR